MYACMYVCVYVIVFVLYYAIIYGMHLCSKCTCKFNLRHIFNTLKKAT